MKTRRATLLIVILILLLPATVYADTNCPPRSCGPATSYHLAGYEDVVNRWVPGLISNASWFADHPDYSFGRAVFYAPGLMEATAAWRELSLDGYLDGVSLFSPSDIGKTVWLRRSGLEWEGPFLVVDCAAQTDLYSVVFYNREVVEVGFRTAVKWEMAIRSDASLGYRSLAAAIDSIEVAVVRERPPEEVGQAPTDYVEWWLGQMTFTDHIEGQVYFYQGAWHVPGVGIIDRGRQTRSFAPAPVPVRREEVMPEASEFDGKPWASFIRDCY